YKFSSPLPPSPEELASRVDETSDPSADVSDAGRDATGHYVRLACNFAAQLSLAARDVFFREELGRSYSLIYGQSQLRGQPSYDLARTLTDAQMNSAFAAWAIGPERVNSAWLDPRPWTERYSIVLWLAVILAALALTLLAIQSLKGGHA